MEVASNQRFNDKQDGRHVGTRTPDLYRVKFAVHTLNTFSFLAFPPSASAQQDQKQPSFGDELVTSFSESAERGNCQLCASPKSGREWLVLDGTNWRRVLIPQKNRRSSSSM